MEIKKLQVEENVEINTLSTGSCFSIIDSCSIFQVVRPLHGRVCRDIRPIEVAMRCWSNRLISDDEFADVRSSIEADRHVANQLLGFLRTTGDEGFAKFKAILRTWPCLHGTGHVLNDLEEKEMEIFGQKVRNIVL